MLKYLLLLLSALPVYAQVTPAKGIDLYNSVGVNTHITYGAPYDYLPYFNTDVVPRLTQANLLHVRESEWGSGSNTQPWVTGMFQTLLTNGVHSDLVVIGNNWNQTEAQLQQDLTLYPGIEAVEAPNECDYNCNTGGVLNWPQNVISKLQIMKPAATALGLPVIGPSLVQGSSFSRLGNISQYLTYGNVHDYQGNRNPETTGWGGGVDAQGNGYGSILWNVDMAHEYAPGLPVMATETGIQTGTVSGTVPEWVQGTYAPRIYLAAFKRGVPRTYYYELFDSPPGYNAVYGLLRYDRTPKPAYTALSNFQSFVIDNSANFAPQPLSYSLTGNTTGVETLLIQKSAGQYWLFVWLDASIWDVTKGVATPVAPQSLVLTINNGMVVTYSGQFNSDGTTSSSWPQASPYAFQASSNVLALRINTKFK